MCRLQTTLLAEGSDDEDADAWVKKSREMEKQKRDAAKRVRRARPTTGPAVESSPASLTAAFVQAAMLDEMDAVFGVSALLAEEQRQARAGAYEPGALRGLRVAHDLDAVSPAPPPPVPKPPAAPHRPSPRLCPPDRRRARDGADAGRRARAGRRRRGRAGQRQPAGRRALQEGTDYGFLSRDVNSRFDMHFLRQRRVELARVLVIILAPYM